MFVITGAYGGNQKGMSQPVWDGAPQDLRQDQVVRIITLIIKPISPTPRFITILSWLWNQLIMQKQLSLPYKQFRENGRTLNGIKVNARYRIISELGEGRYGRVFKAVDLQLNKVVAVKLLDIWALEESNIDDHKKALRRRYIDQQDKLMCKFRHPNILACLDVYANKDLKIIVTPFCQQGTLRQQLEDSISFVQEKAVDILKQLAHALAEIHSKNIVHRDLKLENIFRRNGYYLIGDFGLSKRLNEKTGVHTLCGSYYTRAPEVETKNYGLKADIWSLGIIFFLMLSENTSTQKKLIDLRSKLNNNQKIVPQVKYEVISKQAIDFLNCTIVSNQNKRMGWQQMKNHPIFKSNKKNSPILSSFFVMPSNDGFDIQNYSEDIKVDQEEKGLQSIYTDQHSFAKVNCMGKNNSVSLVRAQELDSKEEKDAELAQKILMETPDEDSLLFLRLKQFYVQAMLAKYILDEIIRPIETKKLLNTNRRNYEFMYLLSARCFLNMSLIIAPLKSEDDSMKQFNKMFPKQELFELYTSCKDKFREYSDQLTNYQGKILEIVKSKLAPRAQNDINKYFQGVETLDFTKEEQIEFTERHFRTLEEVWASREKQHNILKDKMQKYRKINQIEVDEVERMGFVRSVRAILTQV